MGAAFSELLEKRQPVGWPAVTSPRVAEPVSPGSTVISNFTSELLTADPAFRNLQIKTWVVGVCPCPSRPVHVHPSWSLPLDRRTCAAGPEGLCEALHPEQGGGSAESHAGVAGAPGLAPSPGPGQVEEGVAPRPPP